MSHILIPSDNRDFVVNYAEAYARRGHQVTVGRFNFDLEACRPDIVHFQWQEEYSNWRAPDAQQLEDIEKKLERWSARARVIISVHNLYPYWFHGNPRAHRLFEAFFQKAEVIHHFSQASKEMICREYPSVADRNHVVRLGFNYDRLLPAQRNRAGSRSKFGFKENEFVYLVLGSLRYWNEVRLVQHAFSMARVPGKRLLMAARLEDLSTGITRLWRTKWWDAWLRLNRAVRIRQYVPDDEMVHLLDAADAVLVVRQNSMGSAVPCLAMTFGRLVITPDAGAIREYVGGAANPLYDPDSAKSLAKAMEEAARGNAEEIGAQNRRIAAEWDWDGIVDSCLGALPSIP